MFGKLTENCFDESLSNYEMKISDPPRRDIYERVTITFPKHLD